jgi:hypothetical protein
MNLKATQSEVEDKGQIVRYHRGRPERCEKWLAAAKGLHDHRHGFYLSSLNMFIPAHL